MDLLKGKKVLVSGASIAGLSTAYWMNRLGCKVTVVEIANEPRTGGTAVDFRGRTVEIVKRMGIFEQLKANALNLEMIEIKNEDDVTEQAIPIKNGDEENASDEIEIERTKLMSILFDSLGNDVELIFNNSITALNESTDDIQVTFKNGTQQVFDFVFGCDGTHSGVRKIWFGNETEYTHFLGAYFFYLDRKQIVDKTEHNAVL